MKGKVIWMQKASTLQECVSTLDIGALNGDNFDVFYTEFQNRYRTDIVKKINYKLKAFDLLGTKKIYSKFILAGHRGVGKSTELVRVSKLCTGYESIFIDADEASGPENTGYTNLLILIADQIMKYGISNGYLTQDDEAFDGLLHYWDSEVEISALQKKYEEKGEELELAGGIAGKVESKFGLLNTLKAILSVDASVNGKVTSNSVRTNNVDEIIHTVIHKNDELFVIPLNHMINRLQEKMGNKRLLLIIEELDKVGQFELVEELFGHHIKAFTSIECDIIFTYPIHLLYDPGYMHVRDSVSDIFTLGVIEILGDDGCYIQEALNAFKELVYKRIDAQLIEDDALEKAIKMSGGLIRDAFTVISEAAMNADIDGEDKITMSYILDAIKPLEDKYSKLINIHDGFNKVAQIVGKPYLQIDDELRELLRAEVVLEYSESRYFVHPAAIKFLKKINANVKEYGDK